MNNHKDVMDQFRDMGIDIEKINNKEYIFIPTQPYISEHAQMTISLDLVDCEEESIVESVTISLHEILKSKKDVMKKYKKILIKKYKAKIA